MTNPYEPPKATLESTQAAPLAELLSPADIRKSLLIAWSVLAVFSLISISPRLGPAGPLIGFAFALNALLQCAVSILSIFYLRGTKTQERKPPYRQSHLSWFGIAWRGYASFIVGIIPMAVFASLLLDPAEKFTLPRILIGSVIQATSILIAASVIFSKDRIGQLRWVASLLRGW